MSPSPKSLFLAALVLGGALLAGCAPEPLRVLYFTKSTGWEHDVVKWENGERSFSEKILLSLAEENNIEFTFSKDGSLFSEDYLARFDVIMFYTSGYLLKPGTDGNPPMTAEGKQALLDAIADGKGFIGIHSASDTFHTFETWDGNAPQEERFNRYIYQGENADPFVKMLGGEFINHGPQQVSRATVIDPDFPGCGHLGDAIECQEEWYSLKEFPDDLHVLLVMETDGMEGSEYQRPPYPLAWAHMYDKGRVWFNGMGHREDVWESPEFQAMLIGAFNWTGGRVDADVKPNIKLAAPEGNVLPPPREEVAGN